MSELAHGHPLLGAYALGVADPEEARVIEAHLPTCAQCRAELYGFHELREMLDEVPPEAFLDGPPEGGDLLLQRTLRQVRAESSPAARPAAVPVARQWPRLALVAASLVALAAATLGAGVVLGHRTARTVVVQPSPPATASVSAAPSASLPAGSRTVTGVDLTTGTKMTATVIPAAGWVRVHAMVEGVPAGKRCQLLVVARDGTALPAGSWLGSVKGEKEGVALDGSALVAPADVASIQVVTFEGDKLITVPV